MFKTNKRYGLSPTIAGGILHPSMSRRKVRTVLHEAGYTHCGGGSFSSVWRAPGGGRVVKVSKPDRGAEAICEASCRLEGNPVLPRYFGRIELPGGGAVYEVEELEPNDYDCFDNLKAAMEEGYPQGDVAAFSGDADECPHPEAAGDAHRVLTALIREAGESRLGWDLHSGNAMMRGDVCVLTDPLYDPKGLTDAIKGTNHDADCVLKTA